MKKTLFHRIPLVLGVGLALVALLASFAPPAGSVLAQDDPEVCVYKEYEELGMYELGTRVTLTVGSKTYYNQWVGLFYLNVGGEFYDGWCIDLEHGIRPPQCFPAALTDASRETPWCEIGYIMTNYSPGSNDEAAAIQLAIWKCKYGKDYVKVSYSGIESRALTIYGDAQGECPRVIAGYSELTLQAVGNLVVSGGLACQQFTATVTDPGDIPLQGIQIQFETPNGSFSPPNGGSLTVPTDGNGEASVTVCWDASQGSFQGSLTAKTEGYWPVRIYNIPSGSIQETIILQHRELSAEDHVAWEQECQGKIEIKKVDGQNNQITSAVATFEIDPNPYTGTGTLTVTDNDSYANYDKDTAIGYIQMDNVIPGNYDITETIAPTGYVIVDTAAKPVTVTCDSTDPLPVIFTNTPCVGKIEIKKVDGQNNQITSAVATFEIDPNPYTGTGTLTVTDNDSYANYDKDTATGYIQMDNVIPGNYDITETIAPTGYVIVDTAAKPVNVTCDSTDPLPVIFTNTPVDARISISPLTDTNKVGENHDLTALVEVNDGTGWADAGAGIVVTFTKTAGVGSVAPPTDTTDVNGEAHTVLTTTVAGSSTVKAEATVIVGGQTFNLVTDGTGQNSGPAEKDWVDARISISPLEDTNKVGEDHNLTALVEVNDGTGTGWAPASGEVVTFTKTAGVGSVSPATDTTDGSGEAHTVLTTTVAGSSTVKAEATVIVGGQTFNLVTDGTGQNSGPAEKDWVDARISISPLQDTNKVGENHDLTALVEVNDGTGWANAGAGIVVTFTKIAGVGSVAPPTDTTDVNGEAHTVLTTTVAGSSTVQASATVTVGGQTFNLVTDGTAGNSGPAEKDWTEPCGLKIIKKDWDTGDIVNRPGLIVRVTPHPYTGTGYLDVEDNVSLEDKDPTLGIILLLEIRCDLCYDIEEIQAPDGYNLDSDPVYGVCVSSIPVVFLYNTQSEGDCETAFAYDDDDGTCFLEYGFSRWGWSIGPLPALLPSDDPYTFAIYAGAGQCDIDKGTLVGWLLVYYDGSTAWVTYTMTSDFTMDETHLYVGSEPLPRDKNGEFTVAPGQYPFIHDPIALTVDQYEITDLSGDIYVVAHAVVCGASPD